MRASNFRDNASLSLVFHPDDIFAFGTEVFFQRKVDIIFPGIVGGYDEKTALDIIEEFRDLIRSWLRKGQHGVGNDKPVDFSRLLPLLLKW